MNKKIYIIYFLITIILLIFLYYLFKNNNIEEKISKISQEKTKSVVSIIWESELNKYKKNRLTNNLLEYKTIASGFFISENWLILSSKHIINNVNEKFIIKTYDNKEYIWNIIYIDKNYDLVVIKINNLNIKVKALEITENNDKLKVWQFILAIWNSYW